LVAAEALGLPVERVHLELGDTDFPHAPPTVTAVSTESIGPAWSVVGNLPPILSAAELVPRTPGLIKKANIDERQTQ
jgi:hypothetical protein